MVQESLSLAEQLAATIRQSGPISFRDWMWHALYAPSLGYYTRPDRERWGREGDYRTSPHRSDLFAATFARYFAGLHEILGRPSRWSILEAGAGDGTFAAGVLSTLRDEFPSVFDATQYIIDEISADSQLRIKTKLGDLEGRVRFESVTNAPPIEIGVVFSNELFDALPVHLITTTNGKLSEILVELDHAGRFVFVPGDLSTPELGAYCYSNKLEPVEGQIIEVNLESERWLAQVSRILEHGYVVTVDYGAEETELHSRLLGTLRAYAKHQFVDDVLANPGECDITTTVNWTRIRQVTTGFGFEVVDFVSQDRFLLQQGALVELQTRLEKTDSEAARLELTTVARDLILPGGMSSSFQVLVQRRQ